MDCSLLGSSTHGILQARILEWVAIPFSRGSPQPRVRTCMSSIASFFFTVWATREAQNIDYDSGSLAWSPRLCISNKLQVLLQVQRCNWSYKDEFSIHALESVILWNSYLRDTSCKLLTYKKGTIEITHFCCLLWRLNEIILWKFLVQHIRYSVNVIYSLSYVQLCDSMDCSLPGSSVCGISQARILEWVAISFSRGSSQPRDRTCMSCTSRQILYHWATREVPFNKHQLLA